MNFERPEKDPDFMKIAPEPIYQFRNLSPSDPIFLPELDKNRKLTDAGFLFPFGLAVVILIVFTIYILATTSIKTLLIGRDECGNFCGLNNVDVMDKEGCEATDYTDYPVLLYEERDDDIVGTRCTTADECDNSNREVYFGRCFPITADSFEDVEAAKYRILSVLLQVSLGSLAMILSTIIVSFLLYVCFRLHAAATFYTLLVLSFIMFFGTAIALWYFCFTSPNHHIAWMIPAIFSTFLVLVLLRLLTLHKRYKLVIQLFEEAVGIIFKSPLLLVLPLLTSLYFLGFFLFALYVVLQSTSDIEAIEQVPLAVRICFLIVLLLMAVWLVNFASGCQCMIVAGTIAAYYFNTDKSTLRKPFFTSVFVLLRFHLGTIAYGSLFILKLELFRVICRSARACKSVCAIILLCLKCLEEIAEYINVEAYIMTAIHGRILFTSGKRAMRLLWLFLLDTVVIDLLSMMIMVIGGYFVLFVSVVIGYFIITPAVISCFPDTYSETANYALLLILLILLIVCVIVAFYFYSVMIVTFQTLFLCFCEDKLLNDGSMARPFFMSKRLLQLMTEAWELTAKDREKSSGKQNENQR